ncbi:MAG: hypothetical protein JXA77_08500 [Bacteroidales bacterium]|nr:hypothetical protein [Bacteroidales bacterium]MBN2820970.1 hypothetical protein [Bacteroidales bacterium]
MKHTILVAEDEEVNYMYIEVLFEEEFSDDYILLQAINGQEAGHKTNLLSTINSEYYL